MKLKEINTILQEIHDGIIINKKMPYHLKVKLTTYTDQIFVLVNPKGKKK